MPSRIDQSQLPQVIRNSVDPELLSEAQSIEWSIRRNMGPNEQGYLASDVGQQQENYLAGYNLMPQYHQDLAAQRKTRKIEWFDQQQQGRDSGLGQTPLSERQQVDMSPFESLEPEWGPLAHSPLFKVNPNQVQGELVFDSAPRGAPGERTIYFERSKRILSQEELDQLGVDPKSISGLVRREFEVGRQRARSVSPNSGKTSQSMDEQDRPLKKTIIFGSVEEIENREQEFYPYRDAHQGKPLPGDNEYGTWGSRYDDKRQWKLCNGQWVRVAEPKPQPKPERVERVPERPPRRQLARVEPVETIQPDSGSNSDTNDDNSDDDEPLVDLELDRARPPVGRLAKRWPPEPDNIDLEQPPVVIEAPRRRRPLMEEPPVDIDALKDKYRPKDRGEPEEADEIAPANDGEGDTGPAIDDDDDDDDDTNGSPTQTAAPLVRPPTPPLEEIRVQPITPTYVEMKKPLKHPDGEEEKLMEDPNLMWMQMGPAQFGPPFGSLRRRKAAHEEWFGPPCELCHKQIEERRCMLAEHMKFHCWHFACSFCLKTLKPADFLIAEADRKPYCLNCHKREFPEIPLVGLQLDEEVNVAA